LWDFEYGRDMERRVAEALRVNGWSVVMSPGSRGPYDMKAAKRRRVWLVQVKATRRPVTFVQKLSTTERAALCKSADTNGATPVLALVAKGWIFYLSARNWRHLRP
jgi:Holliday junction resolvase